MKKTLLAVCAAIAGMMATSCASWAEFWVPAPHIWDASLPAEETANTLWVGAIVTSFNGIPVPDDAVSGGIMRTTTTSLTLPAGEAQFVMDIDYIVPSMMNSYTLYEAQDVMLTYRLEAGDNYFFRFRISNGLWGLDVYRWGAAASGKMTLTPSEDTFVGFTPFEGQ
jgi:hypothetical protein